MKKKLAWTVVLVAAAAVLFLAAFKRTGPIEVVGQAVSPAVPSAAADTRAAPPTGAPAQRQAAPSGLDEEGNREIENRVMDIYDEIAVAFDAHGSSCGDLARVINTVVDANGQALVALKVQRQAWKAEDHVAAAARLEQEQGPRLERLRDTVKQAAMRCRTSGPLMAALERMATLSP